MVQRDCALMQDTTVLGNAQLFTLSTAQHHHVCEPSVELIPRLLNGFHECSLDVMSH
jgi:hypothetical protein